MIKNSRFMGVFALSMINVSAILNLSSTPSMAIIGPEFVSYFILAALFFFLPTALIAAELATAWPLPGGLYDWVKLAFGPQIGFLSVWLQWLTNIIWYPTILVTMMGNIASTFSPTIAHNKWYLFLSMASVFWIVTIVNLRGMRNSSLISTIGVLLGVIIPSIALISFAVIWIYTGHPISLLFTSKSFVPHLNNLDNMALLVGLIVTLTGMEMSAVHSDKVQDPRNTYAKAAFISILIIMIVFVLISGAMGIIIPAKNIDLITGLGQMVETFCTTMHVKWLMYVLNSLIFVGMLAMASTWIAGPSKGFRIACINTEGLAWLDVANRYDMPARIMIIQAILFTLLISLFLFIPSVNSSYWILVALTGQLYMVMYFIMCATGIYLRYKYPKVLREYSIPPNKWNLGMWGMGLAGLIGTSFSFILSYYQPSNMQALPTWLFVKILVVSLAITAGVPLIILYIMKFYRDTKHIPSPASHELEAREDFMPEQQPPRRQRMFKLYKSFSDKD